MNKLNLIETLANMPHHHMEKLNSLVSQDSALAAAFKNNTGSKLRDEVAEGNYLAHAVGSANLRDEMAQGQYLAHTVTSISSL